ncbi:MAG: hypothetical protein J6O18_06580, partial [Bacilli bacterium]|nr:hypothetical protein [Bacilli bacterium]
MKKILFGVAALGLLGLAGAGLGLKAQDTVEAKADEPETPVYWYYRGSDTDKTSTSWGMGNDTYRVEEGELASWTFKNGEEFKFTKEKDSFDHQLSATATGFYYDKVTGGNGENFVIDISEETITVSFKIVGNKLVFGATGYYTGSDDGKASWGSIYGSKPLVVNGPAQTMHFTLGEQFKLLPSANDWDHAFDAGALASNYYSCFDGGTGQNVYVRFTFDYDVSLVLVDGYVKI